MLDASFHEKLQRGTAADQAVVVKKVTASVRAENEAIVALIEQAGFQANESDAYIPLVFSEYRLDQPLHMRDYYITGRRFDQIEAKQKYVYAVMYAFYSEWELYGYFTTEKKRKRREPYHYESFPLLRERLVDVDLLEFAEWILLHMPLQARLTLDGQRYLFAYAMTSPSQTEADAYYLLGDHMTSEDAYEVFLLEGTEGWIYFFLRS